MPLIFCGGALNTDSTSSTTAKGPTGAFSELVDKSFDEAYELAVTENILPNVRWGRVDYLAVTALTTKWVVWRYVASALITSSILTKVQRTSNCCFDR